jgi:hypothetical protein
MPYVLGWRATVHVPDSRLLQLRQGESLFTSDAHQRLLATPLPHRVATVCQEKFTCCIGDVTNKFSKGVLIIKSHTPAPPFAPLHYFLAVLDH